MFEFLPSHLEVVRKHVVQFVNDPDIELEIRFSTFFKDTELFAPNNLFGDFVKPSNYRFNPFIEGLTFYRMLDVTTRASQLPNSTLQASYTESVDTFYKNYIRHTSTTVPANQDDVWIQKLKPHAQYSQYDIWQCNVRISSSIEKVLDGPPVDVGQVHSTRAKKRWSFRDGQSNVKRDFTLVQYTDMRHPEVTKECYEIEIELIRSSITNSDRLARELIHHAKMTLCDIQDSPAILTLAERHNVRLEYSLLTAKMPSPKLRFVGAQPETLHKEHVHRVAASAGSYALTEKYDGERMLMLISDNEGFAYIFDRRMRERATASKCPSASGTILDCELVLGTIWIFDVIYHKGRDLRDDPNYPLKERLRIATEIERDFKHPPIGCSRFNIAVKTFHFQDFERVYKTYETGLFGDSIPRDGLIFTPVLDPYPSRQKWPELLKWKPADINTIDFQFDLESIGDSFAVYRLLVGGKDNLPTPFVFCPRITVPNTIPDWFNLNGLIVECAWSVQQETFTVLRKRSDKNRPNFELIATDVWKSIHNPVMISDFIQRPLVNMRKHHNLIKRHVLTKCMQLTQSQTVEDWADDVQEDKVNILELACGRGGDMFKWKDIAQSFNVEYSWTGVDVDGTLINEAKRRLSSQGLSLSEQESCFYEMDLTKTKFVNKNAKTSHPNQIPNQIPIYHIVSCQFALHYFFGDEREFETMASSITDNLVDGGIFACSLFDGNRVLKYVAEAQRQRQTLQSSAQNSHSIHANAPFSIVPEFDPRLGLARNKVFGNGIRVRLNTTDVILNKETTEYIVFPDQLIRLMFERSLHLVDTGLFEDWNGDSKYKDMLTDVENVYSHLHRWYIFRKMPMKPLTNTWHRLSVGGDGEEGKMAKHFTIDEFIYIVQLVSTMMPLTETEMAQVQNQGIENSLVFLANRLYVAFKVENETKTHFVKPKVYSANVPVIHVITNQSIFTKVQLVAREKKNRSEKEGKIGKYFLTGSLPSEECKSVFEMSNDILGHSPFAQKSQVAKDSPIQEKEEKRRENGDDGGGSGGYGGSEVFGNLDKGLDNCTDSQTETQTPRAKEQESTKKLRTNDEPNSTWTIKQLREYAKLKKIKIPAKCTKKNEILDHVLENDLQNEEIRGEMISGR